MSIDAIQFKLYHLVQLQASGSLYTRLLSYRLTSLSAKKRLHFGVLDLALLYTLGWNNIIFPENRTDSSVAEWAEVKEGWRKGVRNTSAMSVGLL
jgi:hypothetical protein